jgi:multidrug efflux system membrane fusion protein
MITLPADKRRLQEEAGRIGDNPAMKANFLPSSALLLLVACGGETPPGPPPDIRPVRAEQVGVRDVAAGTRYAGTVRARYETDLAFRVGGRVQTRVVELGSAVKAGQVLATLDPQDYALATRAARAQLAAAEAEARLAQQDLERFVALRAQNFISEAELDRRRAAADAAVARAQQLRAEAGRQGNQQAYTRLVAPHAGVITELNFEAGQVVAAGQPLARLARTGEPEVRIDVPENALADLKAAKTLTIRLWSVADRVYAGALRELSPMAEPTSRTYAARVRFVQPDADVRLGMTATVEVAGPAAAGLSVPQTALFRVDGQPQVWVVDAKSGKVSARSVRVVALDAERARVGAGLAAGEWVVTAGVHKIAPGQRVRLVETARP